MTSPAITPVLIAEDDAPTRKLLAALLHKLGFSPIEVRDGLEALETMETSGIHIVISDWDMPGMDGPTLCQTLRERHPGRFIYIVMLTGREDAGAHMSALDAGADDFIRKPISTAELRARLRTAQRMLTLHSDLAIRNQKLNMAHAFLSKELASAQKVQFDLLPKPASLGAATFDWILDPSCYIGGDTFDYFMVNDRLAALYILDVSGHGVAAAMLAFTAHTRLMYTPQQIAAVAEKGEGIEIIVREVVTGINRHFLSMKDTGHYMTMIFGILDTETGQLCLAQSGHPPPLLLADADTIAQPLGTGGLAIGMFEFDPGDVEVSNLTLPHGSRLFLYSDGVTECESPAGDPYGQDRLGARLGALSRLSLHEALASLKDDLLAWRGSDLPEDDVTVIAMEFGTPGPCALDRA
ncbi:MAG: fused response regulator/phosphatase [Halothiobacillaceae bacterium]|nr:MAG: fused response regulator/phosphatase [Halothiobacillaceae bacterium]